MAITFFIMALFNSEALKRGKIAVVEPVFTLEIPVVVFLAFLFLHEGLTGIQLLLVCVLFLGLLLVSLKPHHFSKRAWLEK